MGDVPNQVCKFYLAGQCAYGSKCRYDHVRPEYTKRQQQTPQQVQEQQRAGAAGPSSPSSSSAKPALAASKPPLPPTAAWASPAAATGPSGRASGGGGEQEGGGSGGGGDGRGVYKWPSGADEFGLFESVDDAQQQQQQQPSWEGDTEADEMEAWQQQQQQMRLQGQVRRPPGQSRQGQQHVEEGQQPEQQQQQQQLAPEEGPDYYEEECGEEEHFGGLGLEGEGCSPDQADAGGRSYLEGGYGGGEAEGPGGEAGDEVVDPADIPLCPAYERDGACAAGEDCPLVHGDECELCGLNKLHPYNQEASDAHRAECAAAAGRRSKLERGRQVECGICLERVLKKPELSQRRFGLMACDHAFCLHCIRSWRAVDDVDVDAALRTCPVCRTTTHFITPSTSWPETPDEKEAIVSAYKGKMAAIDCMHFDYGEGACPFGTSCFYRHAYRDGTLAPPPDLRRAADEEGMVRVLRPVTLSSFLDTPEAQRLLSAAPRRRLAGRRR